jgi:PAS domain S-box-containing protein
MKRKMIAAQKPESSEEHFFNISLDMLCISGMDGYFKRLNPVFEKVLGFSLEELCSRPIVEFIHPDDVEPTLREIESQSKGSNALSFENRYICKDGTYRWLSWNSKPVGDRMYAVARDVTERKNRELKITALNLALEKKTQVQALELDKEISEKREQESRFRHLADAMPQLAWIAHPDGAIFWYNQGWYKYTGTTPEQMKGWGWKSVHDPEILPGVLERWQASIKSVNAFEMEFPLRGADGSFRWFLTRVIPVIDTNGVVCNWFGTNTDVHEQRLGKQELEGKIIERTRDLVKANESLEYKNKLLEVSNKELEDFAYITSHDLKEPLRGIGNYATFLLEDYGDKLGNEAKSKLETLPRLVNHMESLLDGLLYYSKVSRTELNISQVNLALILESVLKSLDTLLTENGAEVVVHKKLPTIACDPEGVTEIFRQLISNALIYNDKKKKRIEVGFITEGQNKIFVRDNGIGILSKHFEPMFRIFKRLNSRKKLKGGVGIGLTVAKKLIEKHGGRIWVNSQFGDGTTFYFTLEPRGKLDDK